MDIEQPRPTYKIETYGFSHKDWSIDISRKAEFPNGWSKYRFDMIDMGSGDFITDTSEGYNFMHEALFEAIRRINNG